MKIKRFVRAQELRGAFSLSDVRKSSPELYSYAQHLNSDEIRKILFFTKEFIPLDFIALLYHANQNNFIEGVQKHIKAVLYGNEKYKNWLTEMGLMTSEGVQDLVSLITTKILSDDPLKRGLLNEIILDGSYSNVFRYEKEENVETANRLKSNIQISNQGLAVPFCPVCKELGIEFPLWEFDISNGKFTPKFHMHKDRCMNIESLEQKEISLDEAQELETEKGLEVISEDPLQIVHIGDNTFIVSDQKEAFVCRLNSEQINAFKNQQRSLDIVQGELYFRCTFSADIPHFSAFFGFRGINAEISTIFQQFRNKLGKGSDLKKLDRLKELEEKSKKEQLSLKEKSEVESLRKYKEKRDREFIVSVQSIDSAVGGEGEKDRTLHEKITKVDLEDFDEESVRDAELNLSAFLDQEDMELLEGLKQTGILFSQAINAYKNLTSKKAREITKEDKASYDQIFLELGKNYLYGSGDAKKEAYCSICSFLSDREKDQECNRAVQMQRVIYDLYVKAQTASQFFAEVKNIEEDLFAHYKRSQLTSILQDLLTSTTLELNEEDVEVLDLTSFDEEKEKLDFKEFIKTIIKQLPAQEIRIFTGNTLVEKKDTEIDQQSYDMKKVQRVAKDISQLIAKVDEEDLLEELLLFHRS